MKPQLMLGALALALIVSACGGASSPKDGHADDHTDDHAHEQSETHTDAEDTDKGQHGGRLLQQDGYSIELAIAEDGTPPKFQAWLYRQGKPLPASAGSVEVRLQRLGGIDERHTLAPQTDGSLMAAGSVGEPHSFDVEVRAKIGDKALRWTYPSYEGRTRIEAGIADEAGIRVAPAAAGVIADEHEVQGLLTPVEGRVVRVTARFPGPIRRLNANVGDSVRAGQVMATVDSNLSLSPYTITTPIAGVVLARNASVGAMAAEGTPLFEVADLSQLWVDLHIFGADAGHIRPGAAVRVTRISDGVSVETALERVLPGTATASQSTVARAVLGNDDGLWRPGSAVRARITVEQQPAALVVPLSALQRFRDWDVAFVRIGDTYEARPLQLGKRDGTRVEVLSGLREGDQVVVEQSYLVKADIEKSGASHDH